MLLVLSVLLLVDTYVYTLKCPSFLPLANRGFSIGVGDVTPGPGLVAAKEELVVDGYRIILT